MARDELGLGRLEYCTILNYLEIDKGALLVLLPARGMGGHARSRHLLPPKNKTPCLWSFVSSTPWA